MNIKKIKLDLTVKLLNLGNQSNPLQSVKEAMHHFKDEVGSFVGFTVLRDAGIGSDMVSRTYAMRYEKCTLNVDMVLNQKTRSEYLNGFKLN
ncbi:MAG: hypothetical protein AAF849_09315 [Bacteroidota bacterium]